MTCGDQTSTANSASAVRPAMPCAVFSYAVTGPRLAAAPSRAPSPRATGGRCARRESTSSPPGASEGHPLERRHAVEPLVLGRADEVRGEEEVQQVAEPDVHLSGNEVHLLLPGPVRHV